jgi:glycosyltransferase involved in cell wall biosynthesis
VKLVLFANTEWYLYNFRRSLALALREAGHEVLLITPPGPYGERLRALGLRWEPVPMNRRSLNPLRELGLLWHLWRLFRRERPALVHGFTIKCAVYGSIAARLAGVPARINAVAGMGYVFSSNDVKARLLRPLVRVLLRLALGGRRARLILQNPDDVALFERARLVDGAQVRLIAGSGVDCARFVPRGQAAGDGDVDRMRNPHASSFRRRPESSVCEDLNSRRVPASAGTTGSSTSPNGDRPTRVLFAARLLWDKGIGEFVSAARQLRDEGRAVEFLLAGDPDPGNPAAVPEAALQAWVDEGVLQRLGHVEDMPALLATVDMVVLPSYREGLPKGLIEAAACALPLVTTDVPGCRDVVSDGVDGLRVPVRDAGALARAIAKLLDDPELAARLGEAARLKALERFDERIVIARTLEVYAELLGPDR